MNTESSGLREQHYNMTVTLWEQVFYVRYFVGRVFCNLAQCLQYQTAKAYKQHNKILLDIVHDEYLNLVSALSTRSLCQTKITRDT